MSTRNGEPYRHPAEQWRDITGRMRCPECESANVWETTGTTWQWSWYECHACGAESTQQAFAQLRERGD